MSRLGSSSRFEDSFWGSDILSTAGFDALCKRSKIGGSTGKEIYEFFVQRSKIEADYTRSLQRLAKSFTRTDIGESHTTTQAWFQLVNQVEKGAEIHEDAGNLYKAEADRLSAFLEEQRSERRKVQDCVRKSQSNKINAYNKTASLQKAYYSKCREFETAKATYESAKISATLNQKELDKLRQKIEKLMTVSDQSDLSYKNSVEILNEQHDLWEQDMEEACQAFQSLEERRLDAFRRKMWTFSNIGSKVCVDLDDCFETMRLVFELCDIDDDMDEFILRQGSGSERPARIEYLNFYNIGVPLDNQRRPSNPNVGTLKPNKSPPQQYEYSSVDTYATVE